MSFRLAATLALNQVVYRRAKLFHGFSHALILSQEAAALVMPQPRIDTVPGEQFAVGTLFDNASVVHDDEPVHGRNRGQTMGDGNHRLALHHFIEAFLNGYFDF